MECVYTLIERSDAQMAKKAYFDGQENGLTVITYIEKRHRHFFDLFLKKTDLTIQIVYPYFA